MIKKLLLIRKKMMTSTRLSEAGLTFEEEPLQVSPSAWAEESGISHHGFLMELTLKEWEKVKEWVEANPDVTLLDLVVVIKGKRRELIAEEALKSVGLRIHPSAEAEEE